MEMNTLTMDLIPNRPLQGPEKNIKVLLCCQILYDLQKVYKVLSKANLGPESAAPNFYHQKQPNKLYRIFTWCQTHRIHGTGIFTYIWLAFMGFHVTSPIDLMGNISSPTWTRFCLRPSGSMTPWKVSCGEQKISKTGTFQENVLILTCHPQKQQCTMSYRATTYNTVTNKTICAFCGTS